MELLASPLAGYLGLSAPQALKELFLPLDFKPRFQTERNLMQL